MKKFYVLYNSLLEENVNLQL